MNNIEILNKMVEKLKKMKMSTSNMNFIPRQTISVNINDKIYYISLICDNKFQVQVAILDESNNVIDKILELDGDKASITKLQNNLYVFTDNVAYIYDMNHLKENPTKIFLGNLDLQGICSNQENIFAYSITKDSIIKYDPNLLPIQEYKNPYSKGNLRVSLSLACNEQNFFSIPLMAPTEEQHIFMKKWMEHYINPTIAYNNDQIHSCSFNTGDNTLYISMYDLIWIIKDGVEFSYLYYKNSAITSVFYDNEISKLIINFGQTKGNNVIGNIMKLSDEEIKENAIPLHLTESDIREIEMKRSK